MSNYSEKLKDPRWQKKRLEILSRDNFSCRYCTDNSVELQVHHLAYPKGCEPWECDNSDLITACRKCHGAIEDDLRDIRRSVDSPGKMEFLRWIAPALSRRNISNSRNGRRIAGIAFKLMIKPSLIKKAISL